MKRYQFSSLFIGAVLFFVCLTGCHKKEGTEPQPCKTCKALGVDGVNQKKVCSDAEEQAFRNENRGKEVTCQ